MALLDQSFSEVRKGSYLKKVDAKQQRILKKMSLMGTNKMGYEN